MAVKVGNDGGKGSEWVRMGTAQCFPRNCEVCTVCMCSNDGWKWMYDGDGAKWMYLGTSSTSVSPGCFSIFCCKHHGTTHADVLVEGVSLFQLATPQVTTCR